jgi:undecaprenyl diphosphate synthase
MDGNGRWAKAKGLPRMAGHREGVNRVRDIVRAAGEMGIKCLTLYAFSCENWKRPKEEVDELMKLLERFLKTQAKEIRKHGLRLRAIGDISALPEKVRVLLSDTIAESAGNDKGTLVLALNYGSRQEVLAAVRAYAMAVRDEREDPDALDWPRFSRRLYTGDLPDPDLIIRTSGELRVSNFLLLQGAYAEYCFVQKCWPDFGPADLREAIDAYMARERRFGMTGEQLQCGAKQQKT